MSIKLKIKRALLKSYFAFTQTPLVQIKDRDRPPNNQFLIPNVVYQTWETSDLPRSLAASISDFRALNPGLGFYLYNKQDRDDFMHSAFAGTDILDLYEAMLWGPGKADLFRYCILYELGGYYFDINKMCDVPLQSLHSQEDTALISFENNLVRPTPMVSIAHSIKCPERFFLQWGFGFAKGHRILELALDLAVEHAYMFRGKVFSAPKDAVISLTGPGLFTKAVWAYLREAGDSQNVCQLGVDFDGHGVFEVKGSWARNMQVPYYGEYKNLPILR